MDWVGAFSRHSPRGTRHGIPPRQGRSERRDLYLLLWRLQRLKGVNAHDQGSATDAIVRLYGRS